MKVILTKAVNGLGVVGEIKDVKDGYAMNFLIPQKLAKIVNDQNVAILEKKAKQKEVKAEKSSEKQKQLAKKVNGLKIILEVKADPEKKTLFGAINAQQIAEELKKRNYEVEAKAIKLTEPIKKLGFYNIELELEPEVKAGIGLNVVPEK